MSDHPTSFKQSLTLMDATMIVAGSMIGSGIFIVGADHYADRHTLVLHRCIKKEVSIS